MEYKENELFTVEGMTDEELFAHVDHNDLESEKITAPRYSYWKSVFRVFFSKKINWFVLGLLVLIIAFTYIYPALSSYDRFENITNAAAKHLTPAKAIKLFGYNAHKFRMAILRFQFRYVDIQHLVFCLVTQNTRHCFKKILETIME